MTDEEKQGPELNSEDNIQQDPVFYYSREHRLRRATPIVRELNEGKPIQSGFRKTIFGTKGNTLLFLGVMIICGVLFVMTSRFYGKDREVKLGGNNLTVVIQREEDLLILSIVKKAPKSGEVYLGPVDIAVSPVMPVSKGTEPEEAPPVFSHRVYFNPVDSESFYIILPFGGTDFFVMLKADEEVKAIKIGHRK